MIALLMCASLTREPKAMMASSVSQFSMRAGGRWRGEVRIAPPAGSKNSNFGGSAASARLASKKDLIVPMSSQ